MSRFDWLARIRNSKRISTRKRLKKRQGENQHNSSLELLEERTLLTSVIFQESFEAAPGSTYALSSQIDSGFDYFDRFASPDNSNAARDDFQLGFDGSFAIHGQDHDGQGGSATQTITIPGINIAGQGTTQATVALGALNSEPAFQNFEAADGDKIEIFATVDAGSRTLIGRFAPPASGAGDLYLDTDLDGVGDGPNLTVELTDYGFEVPAVGSSLTLEIELTSTDSFEPIVVDNVRVEVPKLLLTEISVTPTAGEFIEIHNPSDVTVDLSDYYISDATFSGGGAFYYNIVTGTNAGGGGFADFLARFPDGATIAPGEYQTIALNGSDNFNTTYGVDATYELFEDGAADAIPDMREGLAGSINNQGGLSNSGEVVAFFQWDGASDLVTDVDYAVWGDKAEGVDKTGVAIDGPDGDATASTYQNETAIASQDVVSPGSHAGGTTFQRIDLTEGAQVTTGGNGIAGNDETSEDLSNTWGTFAPTPNGPFSTDNGMAPVFDASGPFTVSQNDPAGTVVGDVDANDGGAADDGITYSLTGDQMMVGRNGYDVTSILTIGDTISGTTGALNSSTAGDYQPVGILDGLGALEVDANTVRVFANHELTSSSGRSYSLANGSTLTGARISYFDIDKTTRQIVDAGLAYDAIINADGAFVDDTNKAGIGDGGGISRLCSAQLVEGGLHGFIDDIFFAGEEDSNSNGGLGGLEYALDVATGTLHALPALGYAAWENVTPLDTGDASKVALLVGDDREAAPLYLYVGNKGLDAAGNPATDFVSRNGLANGTVYYWKADNGDTTPEQFNGTGSSRTGTWVAMTDLSSIANQDAEVAAGGGFTFSRPEDVATDPSDATRVVFASTGRSGRFPSDSWGTTYIVDVDFTAGTPTTATIDIVYDGDDTGGQFAHPDAGLRSPDNLDWADDGFIYIQEDRSVGGFGGTTGEEASIWRLDPNNGELLRVAQIDRSTVLPLDATDGDPTDIGDWESSGILDVSTLFGEAPGSLLIFDVQAHSVFDGTIGANELVQGGQLAFLERGLETSGNLRINPNTGVITTTTAGLLSDGDSIDVTITADDGFDAATTTVTVNVNDDAAAPVSEVRFATFNTSLSGPDLPSQLSTTEDFNAQRIAEIIQRSNPDVILLNEFNFDAAGVSADLFRENYLEISQNGADPIHFPYVFAAPSNTGVDSGFDLDNDGSTGGDGDAFGFGGFDGQFGMLLLSKYPIVEDGVRTFQNFLWKDMPGAMLPADPADADGNMDTANWYTAAELDVVRLSSKSHWDVPIDVNGKVIHALASHPTPPVFDGPEDRNGTRNHDEIRFFADYIDPAQSGYIYDDVEFAAAGNTTPGSPSGGLAPGESFVILGDLNADPFDGDSTNNPVDLLLSNPLVNTTDTPDSLGGPEDSTNDGGDNTTHSGDPAFDTSDFGEPPGNLRVDYALPSADLTILNAEVFWPETANPNASFVTASDHRLVAVDLEVAAGGFSLQLLHASDLEGGVDAIENAANFAATVDALENDMTGGFDASILLSAGDNYIPGPFFNAAGDRSAFRDSGVFNDTYNTLFGLPNGFDAYDSLREGSGRVDVSIMNVLGFDASAIGNHEFDQGSDAFEGIIEEDFRSPNGPSGDRWVGSQFPYLSANLDFSGDGDLGNLFTSDLLVNTDFASDPAASDAGNSSIPKIAPFTVIHEAGEDIGVIGATTQLLEFISSPGDTAGTAGSTNDMQALADVLNPQIATLQMGLDGMGGTADDINKIILVSHLQQISLESELIGLLNGVDIVVAGGSDTLLADGTDVLRSGDVAAATYPLLSTNLDGDPAAIVSTDGEYSYVGRLVVEFDADGVLLPGSIDETVSGAFATDEAGVVAVTGDMDAATAIANSQKATLVQNLTDAVSGVVTSKDGNILGRTGVFIEGRRSSVRTEETNMGNLTADANLATAQAFDPTVQVSIKNGGGIRAEIGEVDGFTGELLPPQGNPAAGKVAGEISQLDVENSLRFNNGLTVMTVTAEELERILEHGVAASAPDGSSTPGQFPQVGGLRFSYDATETPISFNGDGSVAVEGQRIRSLALVDDLGNVSEVIMEDGVLIGDPDREIRIVTLDFLAGIFSAPGSPFGGDNYPFPAFGEDIVQLRDVLTDDGASTFAAAGSEQDALAEYLLENHSVVPFYTSDTDVEDDRRIVNLFAANDSVLSDVPNHELTFNTLSSTPLPGAEISAFDPGSQRLFVTSGAGLQIVDLSDPTSPALLTTLLPTANGATDDAVTSVTINDDGLVAASVPGANEQAAGSIFFYNAADGAFQGSVTVGALPDMVTFTPDGNQVLVANEGEPSDEGAIGAMAIGENGFQVEVLLTIGETLSGTTGALNATTAGDYTPPGVLDGLGAYELDANTVRVFANHELLNFRGYDYEVSDGAGGTFTLDGARISYLDIDKATRQIVDGGIAYDLIYDANGNVATDISFLANDFAGFSRFCSSVLVEMHQFGSGRGLEDTIYFSGEEDGGFFNPVGGAVWALDVASGELWHVPAFGRGAWENITEIDTGTMTHVSFILADDSSPFDFDPGNADGREAAPLYLYVGEKDAGGDFLAQNGLRGGKLYVWVSDTGELTPTDFNTTGTLNGTWVEVDNSPNLAMGSEDGSTGFDEFGFPTQGNLWLQAKAAGAFGFSRPEDVATNPADGTEIVLASTGVDTFENGVDTFGTIYTVTTDFTDIMAPTADITIIYDGDADLTRSLRSPDNLDWADDGFIYIQEDEAEEDTLDGEPLFGDGAANPKEAGIIRLDPATGDTVRVATIDRSIVLDPTTSGTPVDTDAGRAGEWETSGILDVSNLFGEAPGSLFLFDIQAHGIEDQDDFNADSRIHDNDLVEGGQLAFLQLGDQPSSDPAGSISIVDVSGGVGSATVATASFTDFDGQEDTLREAGVRIFPGKSVSQDLEPEYIAVSPDGSTAFVSLQENNAVAVVDIASATVTELQPLGTKDHTLPFNQLDPSNRDSGINIGNWPVVGIFQPDSIAAFDFGGETFYVTANEGDARDYDSFSEELRGDDLTLDPTAYLFASDLQDDANLGRLKTTSVNGDLDGDGDVDEFTAYGARSFSIFDAAGDLVYDSGDIIARTTAALAPALFNANDGDPAEFDERSDDKGAEPEGLTVASINDATYAFVSLERTGGTMVFNITDPEDVQFVDYLTIAGDIAPEGLTVIGADDSPTGADLLVITNEDSNTVSVVEMTDAVQGPGAPVASNAFDLAPIGTFSTGIFDEGAAEILAHDPATQRLFFTNADANSIGVLDISNPTAPTSINTIDLTPFGAGVNSVAVHNGVVAAAVEAATVTDPGSVVFFDTDGNFLNSLTAGALPDMLTFTPDGSTLLVANEGEPDGVDPEGSVTIIDLTAPIDSLTAANVRTADFTAFNGTEDALRMAGVRIFDGIDAANDFEPEYIAISADSSTAFVTLQENNAVAVVDIATATVTEVQPLGTIDHSVAGFGIDPSDRDDGININNWPVFGLFMPDAIASFDAAGQTFYVTANEGDDRGEDERIKDLTLDPTAFPNAAELQADEALGRLGVSTVDGDIDGDSDFDQLFSYGTRSFSIFDAAGNLVFDSGDDFESITANALPEFFNSNNDDNDSFESRSDNKGPEPEAVTTGVIGDRTYAFIGLERVGGIMVYDVTVPEEASFVTYVNNRDFSVDATDPAAGDLGVEGLAFIHAADSPTGTPLLATSNEVSGTVTIFAIGELVEASTGGGNATFALNVDGDIEIRDAGNNVIFTGDGPHRVPLLLQGTDSDDLLTIDFANGNPLPAGGLFFNGLGQSTGGDAIELINGTVDTVEHFFQDDTSGSIDIDGSTLTYTGLEPIFDNLSATNRVFEFGPAADVITIDDGAFSGDGIGRISSAGTSETVDFVEPTNSLLIIAGGGADIIDASASPIGVRVDAGGGHDTVIGSAFDDRMIGSSGHDSMTGGLGNDVLIGGGGHDVLNGEAGADTVIGNGGRDTLLGEDGDDLLNPGGGPDTITAGAGNDDLRGLRGDDLLVVTAQNITATDSLLFGEGIDSLNGSSSPNVTLIGLPGGSVIDASAYSGNARLIGALGNDILLGGSGNDFIFGGAGRDYVDGGAGDDRVKGQGASRDTVVGGAGNDTVDGGSGFDLVAGQEGNDLVIGGRGSDTLLGGDGDDTLNGGRDNDLIRGGDGDDLITGDEGNDIINGGFGNDTVDGGAGNDGISGFLGNDILIGDVGRDTIVGGLGNDSLNGGDSSDLLIADEGDDTLNGGDAADTLATGLGADSIDGADAADSVVTEFEFFADWVDSI
ncbi:MAG: choice-of-anchor I family protein [Planctomycetota bacterium]|jgi:2',3'-cyclic-nucleotide 2'-phosphodiesterase (5'-nucleotidase family)/Ca2+-binding RTX toxin-like protein/secreted PhoX family phosphatase